MALKKFGPNDLVINTLKAQPSFEFFVYDSAIYYNNVPLMSGANAISGITIVGALFASNIASDSGNYPLAAWLGFFALVLATINVVGGFAVTNRMLNMIAGKRRGK